jgi:hypothetical protein
VKPEISLKNNIYPKTYYHHNQVDIEMDEIPTKVQVQNLQIARTLIKEQLVKLNLGIEVNPQCIKVNRQLTKEKIEKLQILLKEFKNMFAWIYKDLKDIPLELFQHRIELDTPILGFIVSKEGKILDPKKI